MSETSASSAIQLASALPFSQHHATLPVTPTTCTPAHDASTSKRNRDVSTLKERAGREHIPEEKGSRSCAGGAALMTASIAPVCMPLKTTSMSVLCVDVEGRLCLARSSTRARACALQHCDAFGLHGPDCAPVTCCLQLGRAGCVLDYSLTPSGTHQEVTSQVPDSDSPLSSQASFVPTTMHLIA